MTHKERAALIKDYKDGCRQVADALKGISETELDFHRAPGKWSVRQIVHHLADSEMTSAIRLRKLLVEMNPYIQAYDQDEFAKKLQYAKRPIEPAVKAFEASRETTSEIFEHMTDDDWKRMGEHAEIGPYSAEKWLEIYAAHARNHADQIRQSRAAFKERK
jgi:hypothetical protein